MEEKKFRIGIIGTGRIAKKHIAAILKMPDVQIVAGADIEPGRAEAFFAESGVDGVKCYKSGKDMVDDRSLMLDGVTICTHNRQHAACTIEALEAGLNVLVEKPFTVTLEEAYEVMAAEKKSGKLLTVGFQPRFDPDMIKLKQIIDSGVLGKIYYVQTGGGRRRGIPARFGTNFIEDKTAGLGAVADIGCYALDMVLNSLGNPRPLTVSAVKSAYFGTDPEHITYKNAGHPEYAKLFEVEDFAAALIRLEGGITVDFRTSWAMNIDTLGDTIFLGTKGGLRVPSTECWNGAVGGDFIIYYEKDGEQTQRIIPRYIPKDGEPDNFDRKLRAFVDAVKYGKKSPIPTSEIIYNQMIIDAIARSASAGKEISFE